MAEKINEALEDRRHADRKGRSGEKYSTGDEIRPSHNERREVLRELEDEERIMSPTPRVDSCIGENDTNFRRRS